MVDQKLVSVRRSRTTPEKGSTEIPGPHHQGSRAINGNKIGSSFGCNQMFNCK